MIMDEQDRQELQKIATGISQHRRQSLATVPSRILDFGEQDPRLDPTDKAFDLSKWLPAFMHQLQEAGVGPRSAGVAFKNLSVKHLATLSRRHYALESTFDLERRSQRRFFTDLMVFFEVARL
jgi:hypothetical protein